MLVNGGLHLGPAERVYLDPRLLQTGFEHGVLHFRLHTPAVERVIGREEDHIKDDERRGQKFIDRPVAAVERVGIDDRGVIENVVCRGKAAEQKQRVRRGRHGRVGGTDEKAVEQIEDRPDHERIADLSDPLGAGEGRGRQLHPARELTAEISRADAHQRHGGPLFQNEDQNERQRQVDDERIEPLCRIHAQRQPAHALDEQEQRAGRENERPLPRILPAAGNEGAQEQSVEQHQPVVENAERGHRGHRLTPPSARTAASCSPFEAADTKGARPAAFCPKRCADRRAKAPRSVTY